MKTWILTFVAIIAIFGIFAFVGCDDGDNSPPPPDPREDFLGTWIRYDKNNPEKIVIVLTIDINKFVDVSFGGQNTYTLENLTWIAFSNSGDTASSYPAGYKSSGTVTNCIGVYLNGVDKAEDAVGQTYTTNCYYLHTDEQSFHPEGYAESIYYKKSK